MLHKVKKKTPMKQDVKTIAIIKIKFVIVACFLSRPVKHPLGSPKKFQEPSTENLQRPSEASKKERGHRKADPSQQHRGGQEPHTE